MGAAWTTITTTGPKTPQGTPAKKVKESKDEEEIKDSLVIRAVPTATQTATPETVVPAPLIMIQELLHSKMISPNGAKKTT